MNLHPYSSEQLNKVLKDDNFYEQFQQLVDGEQNEDDGSEDVIKRLSSLTKIFMMEFQLKSDEFDKVLFLLKVASCCNGNIN